MSLDKIDRVWKILGAAAGFLTLTGTVAFTFFKLFIQVETDAVKIKDIEYSYKKDIETLRHDFETVIKNIDDRSEKRFKRGEEWKMEIDNRMKELESELKDHRIKTGI